MKILVIDDDRILLKILKRRLPPYNYDVLTAEQAEEGLKILKKDQPELVILDFHMPGLNGGELLESIKKDDPDLPIIMLTGESNLNVVIHCLRKGASDYIIKPVVDYDTFDFQIRRAIRETKTRKKLKATEQDNRILEEKLHMQRAFLANVSHELKTPLNIILGMSQTLLNLLENDKLSDKNLRDCLGSILSSGQNLTTLINDLLDLAKIEAGKLRLNCNFVQLKELLIRLKNDFTNLASSKEIEFNVHLPDQLPLIWADPQRLIQILNNLIGNAIKFTEKGGVIRLIAEAKDQDVKISIQDSGCGIAPQNLAKIFEPFERVEKSGKIPGTGLGLPIAKSLIESMGGNIGVESEMNKGSTFFINLKPKQLED